MKRNFTLCAIMLAIVCLASCKKSTDDIPADTKDLVLTPVEQQKVLADNAFTIKLFKQVASAETGNKNYMLSPLSVSIALGVVSNGASGSTFDAIRNTFEFKNFSEEQINSYYKHLITDLPGLDPLAKLSIANSIWYRNGFSVLQPFLQTNAEYYKATAEALDFTSPAAVRTINKWVSDKTNAKITSIIDGIPADAVMYLINAVYFKSNWQYQFDKSRTAKRAFYLANGTTVQTDMMTAKATVNVAAAPNANLYELPYGNGKYSMIMLVPTVGKTIQDALGSVDTVKWKGWMNDLHPLTTEITMPKFKFAFETQLRDPLSTLGMGVAFSSAANFTRITTGGGIAISEIKHKTFIEVNEEGTEAAAVTSVGFTTISAPQAVVIDRPFLFAIREMKTGLILFAGVVNNPLLTE